MLVLVAAVAAVAVVVVVDHHHCLVDQLNQYLVAQSNQSMDVVVDYWLLHDQFVVVYHVLSVVVYVVC